MRVPWLLPCTASGSSAQTALLTSFPLPPLALWQSVLHHWRLPWIHESRGRVGFFVAPTAAAAYRF